MTHTYTLTDSSVLRAARMRLLFKRERSAARVFYSLQQSERFAEAMQAKRMLRAEAAAEAVARLYAAQERTTLRPAQDDGVSGVFAGYDRMRGAIAAGSRLTEAHYAELHRYDCELLPGDSPADDEDES
jgi:hypothetical protein